MRSAMIVSGSRALASGMARSKPEPSSPTRFTSTVSGRTPARSSTVASDGPDHSAHPTAPVVHWPPLARVPVSSGIQAAPVAGALQVGGDRVLRQRLERGQVEPQLGLGAVPLHPERVARRVDRRSGRVVSDKEQFVRRDEPVDELQPRLQVRDALDEGRRILHPPLRRLLSLPGGGGRGRGRR